jgi:gamma-glutamylcyclotransferase (GGCT)/AIG2-like uncharacterized protein YtfP
MSNLVFVYGSLKSGGMVRGLDGFPGATIVGKAKTTYPDFNMLDLGSFPAVVKGEKYIQGEVWEVDDTTFQELDMIEGYPDFYKRVKTETTQGRAWMYFLESDQYRSLMHPESNNIDLDGDTLIWKIK